MLSVEKPVLQESSVVVVGDAPLSAGLESRIKMVMFLALAVPKKYCVFEATPEIGGAS